MLSNRQPVSSSYCQPARSGLEPIVIDMEFMQARHSAGAPVHQLASSGAHFDPMNQKRRNAPSYSKIIRIWPVQSFQGHSCRIQRTTLNLNGPNLSNKSSGDFRLSDKKRNS